MIPSPYIYAFICTRSNKISKTLDGLLLYLRKSGVEVRLLVDKESMFDAYDKELELIIDNGANPDDIVIMCHDDVEIMSDPEMFITVIRDAMKDKKVGIAGVAGTRKLPKSGIWWEGITGQNTIHGNHSGTVFHGPSIYETQTSYYGTPSNVVVVDGVFMVSTVGLLDKIDLKKPKTFSNGWHFYDLTYCLRAYENGNNNKVIPILIRHESGGEVDMGWEMNRRKFVHLFRLPVECPKA